MYLEILFQVEQRGKRFWIIVDGGLTRYSFLHMNVLSNKSNSRLSKIGFTFFTLLFSYGLGIVNDVAISDDYSLLSQDSGILKVLEGDGRFFAATVLQQMHRWTIDSNFLISLRIFSFLCLFFSALIVTLWISRLPNTHSADKATTLAFLIPGFMVYAQVAYGYALSLSLLLSVIGGVLLTKTGSQNWFWGSVLIFLAFASYQPAAFFCINLFFLN